MVRTVLYARMLLGPEEAVIWQESDQSEDRRRLRWIC